MIKSDLRPRTSDFRFSFQLIRGVIFCILTLSYILVYFHRMAPGVVSEYLMADFGISGARLGLLSAIYFFVYAAMQLPSGILADTLGTQYSVIGGNLVAGLGSILFGLAPTFALACAGRFFVGLGVSVIFVGILKNNSVWFKRSVFGLMSGLTLFIGNLGSATAATPLSWLLNFFRWRTVFVSIGVSSLVLTALACLFVRNRPEDFGLPAPNPPADPAVASRGWMHNLKRVLITPEIWPAFWIQFGITGTLYSFMGLWGIPYLRDVQYFTRPEAAQILTVMLLTFAFGALFFGWFSDRIGRRKPLLIGGIALFNFIWLLHMFSGWGDRYVLLMLFGLMGFAGSCFVLTFACAKEIVDPDLSGMAVSVVNTGCFLGTALLQPAFGWLAEWNHDGKIVDNIRIYSETDYRRGFLLMLALVLMGLFSSFRLKETYGRHL